MMETIGGIVNRAKRQNGRVARWAGTVAALALVLAGCEAGGDAQSSTAEQSAAGAATSASDARDFFSADRVHTISAELSEDDYQGMLSAYSQTQDKEWIPATVTIDGVTFEEVGLRLKGNSSLRSLLGKGGPGMGDTEEGDGEVDAERPETLPWLIRLDKYVDGQSYSGRTDFVVRGNNSETSLNEAVALAILSEADVPAQQAAYVRFSVNGSDDDLRVVVDLPDDALWNEDEFGGTGYTYKADSEGDYSYRGSNPEDYEDAFKQKFGDEDMTPLIEFLDFVNNATDEEFSDHLGEYLEIEEFATYLAAQDLIANDDDIDGPGNNSYLHYDTETGRMTVVAWDHNLAFGGFGNMGGGLGAGPGSTRDSDGTFDPGGRPDGFEPGEIPEGFGPGERSAEGQDPEEHGSPEQSPEQPSLRGPSPEGEGLEEAVSAA